MLKTRLITAALLLTGLGLLLFLNSFFVFSLVITIFFAAAIWETLRLFGSPRLISGMVVWLGMWSVVVFTGIFSEMTWLAMICVLIWVVRFIPLLTTGLPALESIKNRWLLIFYCLALSGAFLALLLLFQHSPLYLLFVLAIVWLTDSSAYFFGKKYGRHKLAPAISPGKTWEGAIGGCATVLIFFALVSFFPGLSDTFSVHLYQKAGGVLWVILMILIVAISIIGDLFESQLKRRRGVKDSSQLLPGHGGVLDRIDALIPVLPMVVLLDFWL